jgi:hypothetical protein
VLKALPNHRRSGKGYTARCPAHDDNQASLSVSEGERGKVLLNCHAGCSTESVVKALGLTMPDLFPAVANSTPRSSNKDTSDTQVYGKAAEAIAQLEQKLGRRSSWWTDRDAKGDPVAVVVRWDIPDGKTFRPVARVGTGWRIGDPEGLWPLYHLPTILQSQGRVYVCEGEKATEAVLALGLIATTSAHGAKAADKSEWSPLAGREVVILPDHDDAGASYAADVAALLATLSPAPTVKIVNLPDLPLHGDAVEHIATRKEAGLDDAGIRAELNDLADNAKVVGPPEPAEGPVLVSLADVKPEPVSWLWHGRVALGKLTLLVGDPGLGKSFVTLDIAARLSKGRPWPDAPAVPTPVGGAVLLNAEDDPADTIRPRLDAADADLFRIKVLQAVQRKRRDKRGDSFCLQTDIPALEEAIRAVRDCRVVVIDPITAYLGRTDSHNNAEVRGLLAPLTALAAEHDVAVLAVTHLNKSQGGPAIYRAMGSLAFAAAARAVWGIIKDKDDPQRRLFLPVKNNLGGDAYGLAYSIVPSGSAAVVAWEPDPVTISADDALANDAGKRSTVNDNEAVAWLREALKNGPMASTEVLAQAKANGFTEKAIRRALEHLGGSTKKGAFDGGWRWTLPDAEDSPDEDASPVEGESWQSS